MSETERDGRTDIQEGDMVRFEPQLSPEPPGEVVKQGEVVETPPWSYKASSLTRVYEDYYSVRVSPNARLLVPPEQIKEVNPK
jgi:hypothetical protein